MLNPNSENQPIQLPITHTLETLGWQHRNCFDEFESNQSHLGRENKSEVVLKNRLRSAMEKLNPQTPTLAINTAIEKLSDKISKDFDSDIKKIKDLSSASVFLILIILVFLIILSFIL